MSTKGTISFSNDPDESYHFYEEAFNNNSVYLKIENPDEFTAETYNGNVNVSVSIPIKVWRKIVTDWLNSHWAKNSEIDNTELQFNIDIINKTLQKLGDLNED